MTSIEHEPPRLPGWVVEGELAVGGQALVYRVRREGDPAHNLFVAKVFRGQTTEGACVSPEQQRARLKREVFVLRVLEAARCPHVVRLVEHRVGEAEHEPSWYVMPDYRGGPMCVRDQAGRIVRWAEPYRGRLGRVVEIAAALADALACMHAHDPVCLHRDLHTSNVLLWDAGGEPVLADFGTASLRGLTESLPGGEGDGPQLWRPPEYDAGDEPWHRAACPASDVFMLGGLVYEALSGGWQPHASGGESPPWLQPDSDLRRFTDDARAGELSALLERMLARRPEARPAAAEVARTCRALLA